MEQALVRLPSRELAKLERPQQSSSPNKPRKKLGSQKTVTDLPSTCQRCKKLLRSQKRLRKIRDEILTTREQYHNARQVLLQYREEALEANGDIVAALKLASSGGEPDTIGDTEILLQRVQNLDKEIRTQAEVIRDIESRLGSLEYQLNKKEANVHKSIMALEDDFGFDDETLIPVSETANITQIKPDDSDYKLPSLLEKYYESIAHVSHCKERLQELEDEHAEEVEARNELLNEDRPLLPPEPVFLQSYINSKTTMIQDHLKARQQAQQLRQECIKAGLKVEMPDDEEEANLDYSKRAAGELLGSRYGPEPPTDGYVKLVSASPIEVMGFGGGMSLTERIIAWQRDTMAFRNPVAELNSRTLSEGIPEPVSAIDVDRPGQLESLTDYDTDSLRQFDANASTRYGFESSASVLRTVEEPLPRKHEFQGEQGIKKPYSEPALK